MKTLVLLLFARRIYMILLFPQVYLIVIDLRCRIYIPFGNESEKSAQTVPPFLSGKHIRSTTLPPRSYKFASTHGEVVSYLKLKDPLQGFSDSRVTFMQPDH